MNLQRYAIVIVCLAMFAFGVSAPAKAGPDAPYLDVEVTDCTEQKFNDALAAVQAGAGGTITFNCGTAFVYFGSQKIINKNVTIDGGNKISLSGLIKTRIFAVTSLGRLTLKNITLTHSYAQNDDGGAVWLDANTALHADNVTFENNQSDNSGSAIFALENASITLNNTTVQSNTAKSNTSGYGAINSIGPMTITNSMFRGNQSNSDGGAISANNKITIQNSQFIDNSKGAILYTGALGLVVSDSTFTNNHPYAILRQFWIRNRKDSKKKPLSARLWVSTPNQRRRLPAMSVVELFCHVDDFCRVFEPVYQAELMAAGLRERRRVGELCLSEIMTILIGFHQSHYRDFKSYYLHEVWTHQRAEFPKLVSYPRFVALMPHALIPLCAYLSRLFGDCTGVSFIDATKLSVCHNLRIQQHRVFDGLAARGKTSAGWFERAGK